MHVTFANHEDLGYLTKEDYHIGPEVLEHKIARSEILVLRRDNRRIGFLRFGYFWDEIPFMNLLWIENKLRGRGGGTRLVSFWEDEMRKQGHGTVMTSSLSNERAQYLYRKLGYDDCGSLLMPGEPLEIVFIKKLSKIL